MSDEQTRNHIVQQCKAVAHLATALAQVHSDKAEIIAAGSSLYSDSALLEMIGRNTAAYMEKLGDILNGMDAMTEEDDWLDPVFEEAHRRWPSGKSDRG